MRAFLITGLPRSRTFWLAKLVAELDGVASCAHEPSVNMGGLEDLYNYYNQRMSPSEYVGVSDCMLAPMLPVLPADFSHIAIFSMASIFRTWP